MPRAGRTRALPPAYQESGRAVRRADAHGRSDTKTERDPPAAAYRSTKVVQTEAEVSARPARYLLRECSRRNWNIVLAPDPDPAVTRMHQHRNKPDRGA